MKTKPTETKVLSRKLWHRDQSLCGELLLQIVDQRSVPWRVERVRCYVRRNAYDNQSEAACFLWSDDRGWLRISETQVTAMPIGSHSYGEADYVPGTNPRNPWQVDMDASLDALATEATRFIVAGH